MSCMIDEQPRVFLTFEQLAARWGVSRGQVFVLARTDPKFPPRLKFGRCTRVALADAEKYEQELRSTDARAE